MKVSIIRITAITILVLLVPLIAMQFTDEVDWSVNDFVVMGALLLVAGMGIELSLKKVAKPLYKVLTCLVIVVVFVMIWAELAVGIFNTPLAGS
ncbi:MAG TPA: hypothetical protein VGE13_00545 [Candidatus Saccharimonadales bacterium]